MEANPRESHPASFGPFLSSIFEWQRLREKVATTEPSLEAAQLVAISEEQNTFGQARNVNWHERRRKKRS